MCGLTLFTDSGESVNDLSEIPDGQVVFGVGELLFPNDDLNVEVVVLENRRYEGINILSDYQISGNVLQFKKQGVTCIIICQS